MTEIMMDGEPLEVGNEVYCLRYGVGTVLDINKGAYPIVVALSVGRVSYTKDFKICNTNLTRDLYWRKPEIIPPPKPKKKKKVWDWFIEWEIDKMHRNGINRVYGLTESEVRTRYPNDLIQKIDGTEREVER